MKMKSRSFVLLLLFCSLLINFVFVTIYFVKIKPSIEELGENLKSAKSEERQINCKKVYSVSQGKTVCLTEGESKADALSECSKYFRENLLNSDSAGSLKTIDDLDKFRELSIKMCMQEKGLNY